LLLVIAMLELPTMLELAMGLELPAGVVETIFCASVKLI
jgi:hypothetical protein